MLFAKKRTKNPAEGKTKGVIFLRKNAREWAGRIRAFPAAWAETREETKEGDNA